MERQTERDGRERETHRERKGESRGMGGVKPTQMEQHCQKCHRDKK